MRQARRRDEETVPATPFETFPAIVNGKNASPAIIAATPPKISNGAPARCVAYQLASLARVNGVRMPATPLGGSLPVRPSQPRTTRATAAMVTNASATTSCRLPQCRKLGIDPGWKRIREFARRTNAAIADAFAQRRRSRHQ